MKTIVNFFYRACVLVMLSTLCVKVSAQSGKYFSPDNGLSSSLVNAIYQDSRGFVWVSTEYGLNRFDGLTFTVYSHSDDDAGSLANNYSQALGEDAHQNLLVASENALMRYNRATDSFSRIPLIRNSRRVAARVIAIQKDGDGTVWVATRGQGLFRLDSESDEAQSVDDLLQDANVNYQACLWVDSKGNVWIGTENEGLIFFDRKAKQKQQFSDPSFVEGGVTCVTEDDKGVVFVGTNKHGLVRYDVEKKKMTPVPYKGNGSMGTIYCMANINGRLFVGTDGQGLKYYNAEKNDLEDYLVDRAPIDLSEAKIHAIMKGNEGNVWLGLFQRGLVSMPEANNTFDYFGYKSVIENPLGTACILSVNQTPDKHIWVSGDGEGLYELDENGHRLRHLQPTGSAGSVPQTPLCTYLDSRGNFWVGSFLGGISRLDRGSGSCSLLADSLKSAIVYAIAEDKKHNLYFSLFGQGFVQYDLDLHYVTRYASSKDEKVDRSRDELMGDWVNAIFCDRDGYVWLGHDKGVSCFNPETNSFLNFDHRNTLVIGCVGYAFCQDLNGNVWVGTTDGLYRYNRAKNELSHFTVKDGLASNVVCGLAADEKGNIWISTYRGMTCFEATSGNFVNYQASDGLQGNEFTHGAYFTASDGRIFFGGTNGVTAFYPDRVGAVSHPVQVHISDFFIGNDAVHRNTLSGNKAVVDDEVFDAEVFRLSHSDNTFSIAFTTLNFDHPEQITYQYRIDELGDRWMTTSPGVERVTYNNLAPGTYTFRILAIDHGRPSEERVVTIIIDKPWYVTWWAILIYIAVFCVLVWVAAVFVLARLRRFRQNAIAKRKGQLEDAQSQFYGRFSEEIRKPVASLMKTLEMFKKTDKEGTLRDVHLGMYAQNYRLYHLVQQMIDVRNIDRDELKLHFSEINLVSFIDNLVPAFEPAAEERRLRFVFAHQQQKLMVWADTEQLIHVIVNMLVNAFKYTPKGGDVRISLTIGHDDAREDALFEYCEIAVEDTCTALNKTQAAHIFDRFYQPEDGSEDAHAIGRVGMYMVKRIMELHHGYIFATTGSDGRGNRFVARLPLGKGHLTEEELKPAPTPHTSAPWKVAPMREMNETKVKALVNVE
jgi:ligand-binding sensor domain-containing protein/signal transduction histidine kinase